jgi:hypothetical protein
MRQALFTPFSAPRQQKNCVSPPWLFFNHFPTAAFEKNFPPERVRYCFKIPSAFKEYSLMPVFLEGTSATLSYARRGILRP